MLYLPQKIKREEGALSDFPKRLKLLRKKTQLRQKDLADKIGVAQTTIANYERNLRFPDETTLMRLADYFNVTLDYLLGRIPGGMLNDAPKNETADASMPRGSSKISEIAGRYLQMLLDGHKKKAEALIMDVAEYLPSKLIYAGVFEWALKAVGDLWLLNKASIAQEHFVSTATTEIMNKLKSRDIPQSPAGPTLVAASAPGELHDIGVRMVGDFLEMEGWRVENLGSNASVQAIQSGVERFRADVLALSASMSNNAAAVAQVIRAVRSRGNGIPVVVGGQAFILSSGLWREIGADGSASDAQEAVSMITELAARKGIS